MNLKVPGSVQYINLSRAIFCLISMFEGAYLSRKLNIKHLSHQTCTTTFGGTVQMRQKRD